MILNYKNNIIFVQIGTIPNNSSTIFLACTQNNQAILAALKNLSGTGNALLIPEKKSYYFQNVSAEYIQDLIIYIVGNLLASK